MSGNVSVSNTPGLYIGSGPVNILNNAQSLNALLANSASVGFYLSNANTKVSSTVLSSGVTAGTYGDSTQVPQVTVGADGRITGVVNVPISGGGGGTYGNANVAIFLPTYTGTLDNSSTIVGIQANLGTATTNITALQANAGTQQTQIDSLQSNAASQATDINTLFANAATQAGSIQTINANLGAFQTYANATFGTSNYGNANVAAFLPTYGGELLVSNLTVTNQEVTGNIRSTGGYFWGNGTVYGVTRIVSGSNIVVSPGSGVGEVTISSTAGGGTGQTSTGYYGSFFDNTDQYGNVATSSYIVNLNNTVGTNGVSLVNGNAMSFAYTGVYNIAYSIQFVNTDNAQHEANVWLLQNGINLADTASQITIPARSGANNPGAILMTVPFILPITAGDTIQFAWQTDAGSSVVRIASYTTGTSPTRPAIPGVIALASQVTSVVNAYGNANVASFLANFGSNSISTTGNVTAAYFLGNGSQLTGIVSTYGNTQVAAYNNNTYGIFSDINQVYLNGVSSSFNTVKIGATTTTIGTGAATGKVTLASPTTTLWPIFLDGISGSQNGSITANSSANITLTSNSNITAQSGSGIRMLSGATFQADTGTFAGQLTVANIASTAGYYWANGAAYSTGTTFTGNLAGQTLFDGINERIIANAFPLSTGDVTIPGNGTSRFVVHNPVYTNNVLQQPPLANATVGGTGIVAISSQVIGLAQTANVGLQSGYGFASQNRDTVGALFQTAITPVTANTMANSDRVRGAVGSIDLVLTGQTYGVMSSTSQGATTLAGVNGFVNINGHGNVSAAVGGTYGSFITPAANQTANIQYSTSIMSFLTLQSTAGSSGRANVAFHRAVTPFISGMGANLTVQNAIGLHTYSGWAGTGAVGTSGNPVVGRFAILNEDAGTVIQTNGNVVITGNTNLGPIRETQATLGNQSGTITVNYFSGTVQTATLTGNITINTNNITNMPTGGTVTLILTQDSTGSRLLTSNLRYAGASKTLTTTANAIDTISIYYDGTNYLASLVKGYA